MALVELGLLLLQFQLRRSPLLGVASPAPTCALWKTRKRALAHPNPPTTLTNKYRLDLYAMQEFFDCETVASVSTAHSRAASHDLTNFPLTGTSLPAEQPHHHHHHHRHSSQHQPPQEVVGARPLPVGAGEMRRSGSTHSIAASPSVPSAVLAGSPEKAAAVGPGEAEREPDWVVAEGERRCGRAAPAACSICSCFWQPSSPKGCWYWGSAALEKEKSLSPLAAGGLLTGPC